MSVNDIMNQIVGEFANDGSANYIQLNEQIKAVGNFTSIVLGLLVGIVVIGLPIVIVIEIMYINFPIFQNQFENVVAHTQGRVSKTLGLAVHDARIAVQRANTVELGRSANWEYLLIKSKSIIVAFIIVGLVLGFGHVVVQLVMKLAKSILYGSGI